MVCRDVGHVSPGCSDQFLVFQGDPCHLFVTIETLIRSIVAVSVSKISDGVVLNERLLFRVSAEVHCTYDRSEMGRMITVTDE